MNAGPEQHTPTQIPLLLRSPARLTALWIARAWWPRAQVPATVLPDEPETRRRRRWAGSLATLFDLARRQRVAACRRLQVEGWEHLHVERPGEPGRIVTGSRLLGFDLAVLALGWFHRPLLLSPTPDSDPTGRLLTRLQTEAGHRVADTEAWHDSAREHLARGEWLALAADASLRDEDTGTSDALHETFQLSGDTGALIVPVVVRSLGEGHHRLVVAEPFSHQETSPNQLTERLADLGKSSAG